MIDFILIVLILGILAAVIIYLYRAKKSGAACVGCPHGKQCAKTKSSCCNCQHDEKK